MKQKRQHKILNLIEERDIETQEELAACLKEAGFDVTQATVSRDIRELKLSKISIGSGKQKYISFHHDETFLGDKYSRVLKEGFGGMAMAQNLLVVKTVSGMAMAVAAALDAMKMSEIVGTIAGDDTIMMAIKNKEDTETVMRKIEEVVNHVN